MNGERLFLIIVLIIAPVLFLGNLGNRYLWQDEAETALIGKTILQDGIPRGYDGKNFFSQEGQSSYGQNYIWILDPWLPYYLVAASFKMLGVNTFAARFPFALFGIASVFLTYFFVLLLTKDRKTAGMATVLLLVSVSFLLLCRQSRYYAPVAFFSLLSLYGYLMLLETRKGGSIIFIVSTILVFHCNQLFCLTLLSTVMGYSLIYDRQLFVKTFCLSMIVILVNLPWLLWMSGVRYLDLFGYRFFTKEFFLFLMQNLYHVHYYIFSVFLLVLPLGKGVILSIKYKSVRAGVSQAFLFWKDILLLLIFILITITALSIASPGPAFRYLTQLIPAFCIITAIILRSFLGEYFRTGVVIMAVLFGTISYADYQYGMKYPDRKGIRYLNFFDYLDEITSDYNCPNEGIAKYLNANGKEGDIVAITYGDLPLKFYTKMRIVGGLTGEDLSPVKVADWIIIRKNILSTVDRKVAKYIVRNASGRYRKIALDYAEMPWENRPSPFFHKFRTIKSSDKVTIYQRE